MKPFEKEWLYTVAGSEEVPAEVLAQLYPDAVLYGPNYEAVLTYATALSDLVEDGYPLWLRKDLIHLQTDGINTINTNLIMNRQKYLKFHKANKPYHQESVSQAAIKLHESLQALVKHKIHVTGASLNDYEISYLHNILVSCFYVMSVRGNYELNELKSLTHLAETWESRVKETFDMVVTLAS